MENIVEFPESKVVEQEALDWMIKLDGDDDLSKEELAQLKEWLGRSPVHQEELINLNKFWQNNILTELVVPLGRPEVSIKSRFSAAVELFFCNGRQQALTAIAAVFTIALLVNFIQRDNALLETNGVYLTAVGKQSDMVLADGSHVYLNANSQIEVSYSDNYRNIRVLQGQAHFEVAKNKHYPFRVYAGDGRVEALGTAFSVYLDKDNIDVLVTEGKVAVAALDAHTEQTRQLAKLGNRDEFADSESTTLGTLVAGQRVNVDLSNDTLVTLQAIENLSLGEIERRQAWQEGLLVFAGQPLGQVIDEVSRFSNFQIEIRDDALKALKIGGRFKVGEIESLLQSLETNFDVEVTRLGYSRIQLSLAK